MVVIRHGWEVGPVTHSSIYDEPKSSLTFSWTIGGVDSSKSVE